MRLVIELDGSQHVDQQAYDEERTLFLSQKGLTVKRYWNDEVLKEFEAVIEDIVLLIEERSSSAMSSKHDLASSPSNGEGNRDLSPLDGEKPSFVQSKNQAREEE